MRASVGWVARDFAGLLQAEGGSGGLYCHNAAAAEATMLPWNFVLSMVSPL